MDLSFPRHSFLTRLRPLLILAVALALFLWGTLTMAQRASAEGVQGAQEALRRAAVQCYAIEGRYPTTADYLIEHYGVFPDPDRYWVSYTYLAANLMPEIAVLPLSP